ncbi:hypothetical protein WJX77_003874 [Trebouxia sp. C0004]
MHEPPSKRPPNLTVHSLSTSAHEDSLFSPGVNTPGHRVPLSEQDLFESKTVKRQEQAHSTSDISQQEAQTNSKASWLCCCSQRTADDTAR